MTQLLSNSHACQADYVCRVHDVIALGADTFEVELLSPLGSVVNYQAGQYLSLELDLNKDGQPQSLFYTIANGFNPEQPRRLQLIIQKGSHFSEKIINHLTELSGLNEEIKVTLAMGRAYLQTDLKLPHLLIASGSGISKIKCLTEEILRQQPEADVSIYWSNKHPNDFYFLDTFKAWADTHSNVSFTPILESSDNAWTGRSGYIYQVIEEDFTHLRDVQTYLCGSPQMVYGTIDKLKSRGLDEKDCYSDVFEFAPREERISV